MPDSPYSIVTPPVRAVSSQACLLGEAPLWHPVSQKLYWVDIAGQAIARLDGSGEQRWRLEEQPACLAPTADGGLVVGLRSGVARFDPATAALTMLATAPWNPADSRSNDGRCDPAGRFWTGTVFEPKTANQARLYCLRRAGAASLGSTASSVTGAASDLWALQAVLDDNLTANGLAFDPAAGVAWWSNTPAHVIHQYDFDVQTGVFGRPRVFHQFAARTEGQPYGGRPDGACVDTAGCYWVAMYEGRRVLRLDQAGRIVLNVQLPVTCPTMVCLGGSQRRTLFVTSASKGRAAAELAAEPLAGHVLAIALDDLGVDASVRGVPADLFAEHPSAG